jgi:glycosyltransferase involved in cell wall biosynthesis
MSIPRPLPLRVAHVALQLEMGGMERLLVEFARHHDRRLVDPLVISLGERGPIADEIEACGTRVLHCGMSAGLRPRAILRIATLLREEGVELVHTHNTKPLLYAGPAARIAGVRTVVHTRHGQRHGAPARQTLLFRLAARCADRLVCVSADAVARSRAEGVAGAALRVIPNGVDCCRFVAERSSPEGPFLFVGRLSPEKDIATLIEAMAILRRDEPSASLLIAGGGPCAEEIAALIRVRGLADRVRMLGPVRDIAGLHRGSSCFVLPSRTEGMPLTVIEAMASGLPVVATRVGGVPELVEDGVTGTLVAAGDAPALATALRRMRLSPADASAMGARAAQRARERFDARVMVGAYEALYAECVGDSARRVAA